MRQPMPGAPSAWLPYVVVDDIKASTEKAIALGASVLMDVTAIPGMGHYSIIQDPTGAAIGLWQMA
jgi:predicted enzyme related to lactoylglutathione lyase